jgi:hypothetical protein
MTGAPAVLADLLAECEARGIRLTPAGDGLKIDAPQDTLRPELLARLKARKAELLAMLRPTPELAPINRTDATAVWQAALDLLEGHPLFPRDLIEQLRVADAQWVDEPTSDASKVVFETQAPHLGLADAEPNQRTQLD